MVPYYQDQHATIYHGDCRELLPTIEADVLVTDPPYGMKLRSSRGGQFGDLKIAGDETTEIRDLVVAAFDGPALVFGRWSIPKPAGTRMVLIWDKGGGPGMGDLSLPWKPSHEEIYVLGTGFTGHRGGECSVASPAPTVEGEWPTASNREADRPNV
jgi:site-specific DNA-methyltransferase (adenine-specific)